MQKNILVVDDSDFDRSLANKVLTRRGLNVIEASNGDECLSIINDSKIDLILMDIMMPGLLGTDLLSKIRKKYNTIELPIIMVTSKSDVSDIIECLQSGANDYITKPINVDITYSRISTHLKMAELSKTMSRMQQIATLDAMIATYNHEINNQLSIALGCINCDFEKKPENRKKLEDSLWLIADIIKKIKNTSEEKELKFSDYTAGSKMLKLD